MLCFLLFQMTNKTYDLLWYTLIREGSSLENYLTMVGQVGESYLGLSDYESVCGWAAARALDSDGYNSGALNCYSDHNYTQAAR